MLIIVDAFTVASTSNRNYGPRERFVFDFVLTNHGGGWRPEENEFLCPVSGTYMFSCTSVSPVGEWSAAVMMMGENQVCKEICIYNIYDYFKIEYELFICSTTDNSVCVYLATYYHVLISCNRRMVRYQQISRIAITPMSILKLPKYAYVYSC